MHSTRNCSRSQVERLPVTLGQSFQGNLVAVGTHRGYVQVWDVAASKKLNVLEGHSARVGALAWNGDSLSSGSRDRLILQRDIRTPPLIPARRLEGHRQEVCGLKWSPDNSYLVRITSLHRHSCLVKWKSTVCALMVKMTSIDFT